MAESAVKLQEPRAAAPATPGGPLAVAPAGREGRTAPAGNGEAEILPLECRDVSYAAGGQALVQGLTFRLEPGRRTVLLGPNGAGKSLTLRLCHGLLAPSRGSVRWLGPGAAQASARQAMVFQRPVLLRRSALANVVYALAVRGVPRRRRRTLAEDALALTGLLPLARRQARVLSGGEQQRLALARAWALRPQVLFLDEPTASLDPAAARAVEEAIGAIHRAGTAIVLTTHDLGQAQRLADDVLFLHRGRLLEQAPAAAFFAGPATPQARAFLRGELVL
ncbi:MAG: ATP-binding cassette domain-containing protein [Candidatus Lambdaproteobacteria bacterium]|nr:ATP-binding cassette domain-containing protein [Candidatus Lambdaproteobacteria bacterium]